MEAVAGFENIGKKIIFIIIAACCLLPFVNGLEALLAGFIVLQFIGNPFEKYLHITIKYFLQVCVVGLGFGMNVMEAAQAGKQGLLFTTLSIGVTLIVGILLGKYFSIPKRTALLISSGTAICGGSAIAAVSPVIGAKENEMSVALGTIFILNAIALFVFPFVGYYFHLSQQQFGLWAAIAIHDTSSVVGAAQQYGSDALKIATAVKLERALWIIPVSVIMAMFFKNKQAKIKIPWFILFFVIAMCINTMFPQLHNMAFGINTIAKKTLIVTLFLIGSSLSISSLKNVGAKPFIAGFMLWIFIGVSSLLVIMEFVK